MTIGEKTKKGILTGVAALVVNVIIGYFPALEAARAEITGTIVAIGLTLIGAHAHTDAKVTAAMIQAGVMKHDGDGTMVPADAPTGPEAGFISLLLLPTLALLGLLLLAIVGCAGTRPGIVEFQSSKSADRCYVLTLDDAPTPVMECVAHETDTGVEK